MDERANYEALNNWFQTPQGSAVAHAFAAELRPIQTLLLGKRLLQLGDCSDNPWLAELHYQQTLFISLAPHQMDNTICASVNALPIERATIDCILAPLTMEACAHSKNPIDEMDRVLKSMGYIVFLGINPWSFWGASLRWGRLSCFARASSTLSSSLSLKHAFLARGYRQCWLSSFYYIPPIEQEKWIHRLDFLNQMGKMIWPYPAGFYCLIMQKQDPCMTVTSSELERDDFYLARPGAY